MQVLLLLTDLGWLAGWLDQYNTYPIMYYACKYRWAIIASNLLPNAESRLCTTDLNLTISPRFFVGGRFEFFSGYPENSPSYLRSGPTKPGLTAET